MSKQEIIKELYFNKKYSQKQIAEIVNTSNQYVSKVLLKDSRYQKEKEQRKVKAKASHRQKTMNYIKSKRKSKSTESDYQILKQMHIQASQELSGGRKSISNRAYRNWNPSIYKYNEKTKCYHLKKGIVTGIDVPKKINWKSY